MRNCPAVERSPPESAFSPPSASASLSAPAQSASSAASLSMPLLERLRVVARQEFGTGSPGNFGLRRREGECEGLVGQDEDHLDVDDLDVDDDLAGGCGDEDIAGFACLVPLNLSPLG